MHTLTFGKLPSFYRSNTSARYVTIAVTLLVGNVYVSNSAYAACTAADPTASSTENDPVCNYILDEDTTVSALVVDPDSVDVPGATAWVQTDDGYSFLVKTVGETFYSGSSEPFTPLTITGITAGSATVTSPDAQNPISFDTGLTDAVFEQYFNDEGAFGPVVPPIDDVSSDGVSQVVTGDGGSDGADGAVFIPAGSGDDGDAGPDQTQTLNIDVDATDRYGWEIGSVGGEGGQGGNVYLDVWPGANGGNGGPGGMVTATQVASSTIITSGEDSDGIFAYSKSGEAGDGGEGYVSTGGGSGGDSANGGEVTVIQNGAINTKGDEADGIYALSFSANGGDGGDQWGIVGTSGDSGDGGSGGNVNVTASGIILTEGDFANGIFAQSIGGSGGSAGISGDLLLALLDDNTDDGGSGGSVTVTNSGSINTEGNNSRGIYAQSIGGAGGSGGAAGGLISLSLGGVGSTGGTASDVTATNASSGSITTIGTGSDGIFAQSAGGSGGQAGNDFGLIAIGGDGSNGGSAGNVTVSNFGVIQTGAELDTTADLARGIVAQSIGGGGGDGGSTAGMVSVGGNGDGGGDGALVTVLNDGVIDTDGDDAPAILAQSLGGGGGNGGSAGSVGAFVGVAVGGSGGAGGEGGDVNIVLTDSDDVQPSSIRTRGDRSEGVSAQSVGGGGGSGGGAVSVSIGAFGDASIAVGGSAGEGGDGGEVTLTGSGDVVVRTDGDDSAGIFLQSLGGGGGDGGYAVTVADAIGPVAGSLSVGVGGSGGAGGVGDRVQVGDVNSSDELISSGFDGLVQTFGDRSTGMLLQSLGGGGGNGGLSVSVSGSESVLFSGDIAVGIGGSGSTGGIGGTVKAYTSGAIETAGDYSTALLAQSVGGGGGNGGGSVTAGIAASAAGAGGINVGVGGSADNGGAGGIVELIVDGEEITTAGDFSSGVIAQSIGMGGGNGGYSVTAGATGAGAGAGNVDIGLGGTAGGGGNGGEVTLSSTSDVATQGSDSTGILVQSVGGGGGNGGFAVAAGLAGAGTGSGTVTVGLGGTGGSGGNGGSVTATSGGDIVTGASDDEDIVGDRSSGFLVQSIGGGGGNGGFTVSGSVSGAGEGSGAVSVGLGGNGGTGGDGGDVVATSNGSINTYGFAASGFVAQSIGRGGGNGGFDVSAALSFSGEGSGAVSVGLGGSGSAGGDGGTVNATSTNRVYTQGDASVGVMAQSVGGGGGNGGFNVSPTLSGSGSASGAIAVGIGGSGSGGGDGDAVILTVTDNRTDAETAATTVDPNVTILTNGDSSSAVIAQSLGGGGGNGGINVTVSGSGAGTGSGALGVGIGGNGGGGGSGGTVESTVTANLKTTGNDSTGLLVQSVGMGGGNGGLDVSAAISAAGTGSAGASVGIGGSAGSGGDGDDVTSELTGDVVTAGVRSSGVVVQSLGGGGGNGGINISAAASIASEGSGGASLGIGGSGGDGGDAGTVEGQVTGNVVTAEDKSTGVLIQSMAGGGGNGGLDVSAAVSLSGEASGGISVGIGGSGGGGGDADEVEGTIIGNVTTGGGTSPGVTIQSLGGAGGNGGVDVDAAISISRASSGAVGVGIGGSGGDGGDAATATGRVIGNVSTEGDNSSGVMVQSVGGGGGNGGVNVTGTLSFAGQGSGAIGVGVGGFGGGGGSSGAVSSYYDGIVSTIGEKSGGVTAQSLGGAGGNGGVNVSGAISLATNYSGALGIGVGGFGGGGGNAGNVDHTALGYTATEGDKSAGILTQSLGGSGGSGGTDVSAALSISRETSGAIGIGVGGFGGDGGDGGESVIAEFTGGAYTSGDKSGGVVTQNLGGGGGAGGTNVTADINLTQESGGAIGIGVGGFGGAGGDAGTVESTVANTDTYNSIVTTGVESYGVLAQSSAGGGGVGGVDVTGSVSLTGKSGAAVSLGLGGFGGGGGDSDEVSLDVTGNVITMGNKSHAIVAQSQAGSGGIGGVNVSSSLSLTKPSGNSTVFAVTAGVGGFGGDGGDAGAVYLSFSGNAVAVPMTENSDGDLVVDETAGSHGILAQSLGGGGGSGGVDVAAGLSISNTPTSSDPDSSDAYGLVVGVGGFGGGGGSASDVTVDIAEGSTVTAHGAGRSGLMTQSVGGSGGDGGLNVSGGITSNASITVGVGGDGGSSGAAGDVTVNAYADVVVTTNPDDVVVPDEDSPIWQSKLQDWVGEEVADTIVSTAEESTSSFGLNTLFTQMGLFDEDSDRTAGSGGVFVQSVGGGGGTGGLNISGDIAISKSDSLPSVAFGIGGFGGDGNIAGDVDVDQQGSIAVEGNWKSGLFVQSVGGGGGNGGLNVSGALNWSGSSASGGATDLTVAVGVGGTSGEGADGGDVTVESTGDIATIGYKARGVLVQSVGGGGGIGGVNLSAVVAKDASPVNVGVGGTGLGGGDAGIVTLTRGTASASGGTVLTNGTAANGIEAASFGGGGGEAGVNAVMGYAKSTSAGASALAAEIAIGGGAGNAGTGGDVTVDHYGNSITLGEKSHGVVAQSLGGGGGNAAMTLGMLFESGQSQQTRGVSLAVGGGTGVGGDGGDVSLNNVGDIATAGDDSYGIFAQSVGGGGGNAGFTLLSNGAEGGDVSLSVGRTGGTGGLAGTVVASTSGTVSTDGDRSHGLFAQSIANGGGNSTATKASVSSPSETDSKGSTITVAVGLEGGEGGASSDVTVDAEGAILTGGSDSHGVFAQSVGGGGGTGGGAIGSAGEGASFNILVGGTGGTGGTSGAVTVVSSAQIETAEDRSIGIMAQSLGGGGGVGGYSKSGLSVLDSLKGIVKGSEVGTTASLAIGGTGGEGMTSDVVDVQSTGNIITAGGSSYGIFAQSLGGGGGMGGISQNNLINLRGTTGNQANISVGGAGGEGATGDAVNVLTTGTIVTTGLKSAGVYAQSVGGGGGDAGNVTNVYLSTSAENTSSNSILIGGDGGTGGAGGDTSVVVDEDAIIATTGNQSHGVFAQSVGGGGGSGSDVTSVFLAQPTSGATQSRGVTIAIGGSGEEGGTGGDVEVTNRGMIATEGADAHGILAQSVGGGGGSGGSTIVGSLTIKSGTESDPSLGLSLGGSGGEGNTGGAVNVINRGDIATSGDASYGVYAQSVGGGGGDGGLALAISGNALADRAKGTSWSQIAVGGAGGDGANGGDVDVVHSGTITVDGDDTYGIFAQSVGGGGGQAGYSVSSPGPMMLDYLFSHVLGAREGASGEAGTVNVDSTGDIATNGSNSQAMFVQTVNGGGGSVDTFTDFSEFEGSGSESDAWPSVVGDISLGSDDADNNEGSSIVASHDGDLATGGNRSVALQAQSIGGGGGHNSNVYALNRTTEVDVDITLGAVETNDSSGGSVTFDQQGGIVSLGDDAPAISVQSIGGGGGRMISHVDAKTIDGGDADAEAAAAIVRLGADPSLRNDGGAVELTFNGDTGTAGDRSPGMIVQSIGAGGGESYITGFTTVEAYLGGTDDSTGDGGDVTVRHSGSVTTLGAESDGIVIQSIGGGGGHILTDLDADQVTANLRSANEGDGGDVSLTQEGVVSVEGSGSVGILAQSLGGGGGVIDDIFRGTAGGEGSGGAITLDGDENVMSTGAGGIAIVAQSDGGNGGSNIDLGLDAVIRGGTGSAARAISLAGGSNNGVSLGSDGFIFSGNNHAILATSGNDTVSSGGTIVGNINLGAGENTLLNRGSGVLVTQQNVSLGSDGILTNAGILVPGGVVVVPDDTALTRSNLSVTQNVPMTTDFVGSIELTETSEFQVDAAFRVSGEAGDGGDLLNVTGSVAMDGTVVPTLLAFERALPLTIIDTGGSAVDNGAEVQDTATIDYSLVLGSVQLVATPNFALPNMTTNEAALGRYMNNILTGSGSESLGELFAYIGNLSDPDDVANVLSHFSTQGYAANRVATLRSGLRFSDALRDCERRRPDGLVLEGGRCAWIAGEGGRFTQDAYSDYHELTVDSYSLMGGTEYELDGDWKVGFGAGYENIDLENGPAFSSSSNRGHLGALIERHYGPFALGASLSGSFGSFSSSRTVGVGVTVPDHQSFTIGTATSSQKVYIANIGLNAKYRYVAPNERFYLTPSLGVAATYIHADSAQEKGDGAFGFEIESASDWVWSVSPTIEMRGNVATSSGLVQPFVRAGLTMFDKDDLGVSATFIGASAADGDFVNTTGFDRIYGTLDVGVEFQTWKSNTFVQVSYQGAYSKHSQSHAGSAMIQFRF